MSLSNYPNGFPNGLIVRGVPVVNSYPGQVFWVGSTVTGVSSSDGNKGTSPQKPFATINQAVSKCNASNGDIIFVMPGHVEDLGDTSSSGAIDLDVVGISLIGLGNGTLQPRIDFNHADSDFLVGANNVVIENIHFDATVTGVKLGIAVEAAVTDTVIRNCRFTVETTTTDEFIVAINLLAGCDRTLIEGCKIDMGLGGATDGIKLTGASAEVTISGCYVKGDYSTACITSDTTLSTETMIEYCMLIQGTTGAMNAVAAISMLTGNTGIIRRNDIVCDVATYILMTLGDTMCFFENYRSDEATPAVNAGAVSASALVCADG